MRRTCCILAWTIGVLKGASAWGVEVIDQRHDMPGAYEGSHSIQLVGPIVQEFTPQVGAMDFVEVWTEDIGFNVPNSPGATLQLLLLDNPTNGQTLAISGPVTFPNGWEGVSRFLFTNAVWLTPGTTYALQVRVSEGDNWGAISYGDLFPDRYAGGRYFLNGRAVASDLWFRTGVRLPQPRITLENDGLRWQGVPPLMYRVWSGRNLVDWGEVGTASGGTSNYFFTNIVLGEPKLFYRVTYP